MEIKNILVIGAIAASVLGLSLIFIPTEIQVTLAGVILLGVGMLLGITFVVNRGQP